MKESERKVEGGKLLRIKVDVQENLIKNVSIEGDFFAHPENTIEQIEQELTNKEIDSDLEKIVQEIIDKNNAELVGVTAKDINEVILEALK